ncbi:hypothetical protein RN607_09720 [Demequina capsici]|uniref:Uncharacterized protein n=1 Tax=Demequina capsici TaxID=3075620 RepID=A0AA96FBP4_9MICO|nr:hypothetical protein [Demequina sp. PMTSA13]WNM26477.1 hypothetical protein RN607_09720 [Demequina sp. PMTSA13]
MNEYTVAWPLWNDDGLAPDDEPSGLSPELTARIRAWATHFGKHFTVEQGWPSQAHADFNATEGATLLDQLRHERPDLEFTLDLWETTVTERTHD